MTACELATLVSPLDFVVVHVGVEQALGEAAAPPLAVVGVLDRKPVPRARVAERRFHLPDAR